MNKLSLMFQGGAAAAKKRRLEAQTNASVGGGRPAGGVASSVSPSTETVSSVGATTLASPPPQVPPTRRFVPSIPRHCCLVFDAQQLFFSGLTLTTLKALIDPIMGGGNVVVLPEVVVHMLDMDDKMKDDDDGSNADALHWRHYRHLKRGDVQAAKVLVETASQHFLVTLPTLVQEGGDEGPGRTATSKRTPAPPQELHLLHVSACGGGVFFQQRGRQVDWEVLRKYAGGGRHEDSSSAMQVLACAAFFHRLAGTVGSGKSGGHSSLAATATQHQRRHRVVLVSASPVLTELGHSMGIQVCTLRDLLLREVTASDTTDVSTAAACTAAGSSNNRVLEDVLFIEDTVGHRVPEALES